MRLTARLSFLLLLLITVAACKKPYTPQAVAVAPNYLVVEGFINLTDSTIITLSRTVNISTSTTHKPELKAVVAIESDKGASYQLTDKGNGVYAAASLNLSSSPMYRLRITTATHSTYVSDFVTAKVTPAIDSLTTKILDDGVHFSISTHDASNSSRYYKWVTAETWEFNSYLESLYSFDGVAFHLRTAQTQIHQCWGNFNSGPSLLTSTINLSNDVVVNRDLDFVPIESEKLHVRFSLLVKQYALTKDAYDYWTELKKNTENLGSIFDAQPSSLISNLHNTSNSAEPVIGFISAGTIIQKRIFVANADLPGSYRLAYSLATPYNSDTCPTAVVIPADYNTLFNPKNPFYIPTSLGIGVTPLCADCTLRGTTTRPAFW